MPYGLLMPCSVCCLGTAGSYRWVAGSVGGVSCFKPCPADLPCATTVWGAGQQESWHGVRPRWWFFFLSCTDAYTNAHSLVTNFEEKIVDLLCCFGPLVPREESLQINSKFVWLILFYPVMGMVQDGNVPIHSVWGLIEQFDEYEEDVNHPSGTRI